jgi:hypothetical protein
MGGLLRAVIELGLAFVMFCCGMVFFQVRWDRLDSWLARLAALAAFLVLGSALAFLTRFD